MLTTVDVDVAVDIAMIVDDALDDDDVITIKNLHLFILGSTRHKLLINNLLRRGCGVIVEEMSTPGLQGRTCYTAF